MTIDYYTLDSFQIEDQKLMALAEVDLQNIVNQLNLFQVSNVHLALIQKSTSNQLSPQIFKFDGYDFFAVKKLPSINMLKVIGFKRTIVKNKVQSRFTKTVCIPLLKQDKIYGMLEMDLSSENALTAIRSIEKVFEI